MPPTLLVQQQTTLRTVEHTCGGAMVGRERAQLKFTCWFLLSIHDEDDGGDHMEHKYGSSCRSRPFAGLQGKPHAKHVCQLKPEVRPSTPPDRPSLLLDGAEGAANERAEWRTTQWPTRTYKTKHVISPVVAVRRCTASHCAQYRCWAEEKDSGRYCSALALGRSRASITTLQGQLPPRDVRVRRRGCRCAAAPPFAASSPPHRNNRRLGHLGLQLPLVPELDVALGIHHGGQQYDGAPAGRQERGEVHSCNTAWDVHVTPRNTLQKMCRTSPVLHPNTPLATPSSPTRPPLLGR